MIKGQDGFLVYGNFQTPEEIEQERIDAERGIIRHHPTTYLEYSIPVSLKKELEKMIDRRLEQFYQECQCEDCKQKRNIK